MKTLTNTVSAQYFATLGIPIVHGHGFLDGDIPGKVEFRRSWSRTRLPIPSGRHRIHLAELSRIRMEIRLRSSVLQRMSNRSASGCWTAHPCTASGPTSIRRRHLDPILW